MDAVTLYNIAFYGGIALIILIGWLCKPSWPKAIDIESLPEDQKPPSEFKYHKTIWFDIQASELFFLVADEEFCYGLFVQHFHPDPKFAYLSKTPYGLVWKRDTKEVERFIPVLSIAGLGCDETHYERWVANTFGPEGADFIDRHGYSFAIDY